MSLSKEKDSCIRRNDIVNFYMANRGRWDQFSEMILLPTNEMMINYYRRILMNNEFEELHPMFYDTTKLIRQPQIVYRTNDGKQRYYYSISDQGKIVRLPSVTTVLSAVMPKSEYLIKWISDMGKQAAERKMNQAADYGTLMHMCQSQYLLDKKFDMATIPARINTYKISKRIDYDTRFWRYDLEKDMMAFHKFCYDHDIEPIAISLMLMDEEMGIAGELDIAVRMTIGTGENGKINKTDLVYEKDGVTVKTDKRRRITAIIDMKSGRHGFYPTHEAQLKMYEGMWNRKYPENIVDKVFNWSPKDWDTEPGYNLKDQTDSIEGQKIGKYIELFNIDENARTAKRFTHITGLIELGVMNGNVRVEEFGERMRRIHRIQPINNEELIIENGEKIPASTGITAKVKEEFEKDMRQLEISMMEASMEEAING